MPTTTELIKELREKTGAGIMECKRALDEGGSIDRQAEKLLKEWGLATAEKKAGREASQGLIDSYIHAGRIGAMIELNCETDFVARTDDFKTLAREIAMQVAATNPTPHQRAATEQSEDGDVPLLDQPYIRDPSKTVQDLLNETHRQACARTSSSVASPASSSAAAESQWTDGQLRYRQDPPQAERRSAAGRRAVRHRLQHRSRRSPARSPRSSRAASRSGMVIGGGNIWRGEPAADARHGPRHRRLHGHAGDGHQRPGAAVGAWSASACTRACRARSP